jgi:hypothetical protein
LCCLVSQLSVGNVRFVHRKCFPHSPCGLSEFPNTALQYSVDRMKQYSQFVLLLPAQQSLSCGLVPVWSATHRLKLCL